VILANRATEPQVDLGVPEFVPEDAGYRPDPAGLAAGRGRVRAKEICSLYIDSVNTGRA